MTENNQAAHSVIGASSYSRWSKKHGGCPGSVRLSKGLKPVQSAYADEGSVAHKIASDFLEHFYFGTKEVDHSNADPEMLKAVEVYTDFVQEQALLANANLKAGHLLIEVRFDLSSVHPGLFGTADCVIYWPEIKKLQVIDYKHGAGIAVDVEDNLQLMYYGLGALLNCRLPCETVELVVVQPRIEHVAGRIRTWSFPAVEILDFAADLEEDAIATEDPNAPLNPGDHCRFCPAAAVKCPAIEKKVNEIALMEFKPSLSYDPQQLAKALASIPVLKAFIEQVNEFAYSEAIHGRTPPGWKIVEKRATRKWARDEETIVDFMAKATLRETHEFYEEPKLKSPAQMEKLCSKNISLQLREMMISESSGYSLVPESDKRPSAKLDPKNEFTQIEGKS